MVNLKMILNKKGPDHFQPGLFATLFDVD